MGGNRPAAHVSLAIEEVGPHVAGHEGADHRHDELEDQQQETIHLLQLLLDRLLALLLRKTLRQEKYNSTNRNLQFYQRDISSCQHHPLSLPSHCPS